MGCCAWRGVAWRGVDQKKARRRCMNAANGTGGGAARRGVLPGRKSKSEDNYFLLVRNTEA